MAPQPVISVRNMSAVPVDQYDERGKLVNSYDSVTQAAKANKLTPYQIVRALRPVEENGRYSTGGFFWRRKDQALGNIDDIPTRGAKRRQVRLEREGKRALVFPSQSHAARFLGVPPAYVCQAMKRRGQCKEYFVSPAA